MIRDLWKTVPGGWRTPVAGPLAVWMLLAVWACPAVVPSAGAAAKTKPEIDEQSAEELLKELDKATTDPNFVREQEAKNREARRGSLHRQILYDLRSPCPYTRCSARCRPCSWPEKSSPAICQDTAV